MKIQPLPVPFSGDKFMSRAKKRLPGRPPLQFRKKEKEEERKRKREEKKKTPSLSSLSALSAGEA